MSFDAEMCRHHTSFMACWCVRMRVVCVCIYLYVLLAAKHEQSMSNTISNARQENQQGISAVDWKSWCAARARSVQRSAAVLNAEVLPVRRDPAEAELHGEAAQAYQLAAEY